MKTLNKIGCYVSVIAVLLDVYTHQLLLAAMMVGCFYLNYLGLTKEETEKKED